VSSYTYPHTFYFVLLKVGRRHLKFGIGLRKDEKWNVKIFHPWKILRLSQRLSCLLCYVIKNTKYLAKNRPHVLSFITQIQSPVL
jgi:hypothetical protein